MGSELQLGEMERDGDSVRVEVRVPSDTRYFDGHFPGAPILPGVAQIIALSEEPTRQAWPELGATRGLRRVKFQRAIRPNDVLELQLTRKNEKVTVQVFKAGELCSKGTLVFET